MRRHFVAVSASRDIESGLCVLEARDRQHHFLAVVSEETKAKALEELKGLVLEVLLAQAEGRKDPLSDLYLHVPSRGEGMELLPQDLFPILLRHRRCRRGRTQAEVAAELAITQQVYARLEKPGRSNPTLATIQRLEQALGEHLLTLA